METGSTTLEVTPAELSLLSELLEQTYLDLKQEIGSTEDFRFKEDLKAREATMLALLNKLTGGRFGG